MAQTAFPSPTVTSPNVLNYGSTKCTKKPCSTAANMSLYQWVMIFAIKRWTKRTNSSQNYQKMFDWIGVHLPSVKASFSTLTRYFDCCSDILLYNGFKGHSFLTLTVCKTTGPGTLILASFTRVMTVSLSRSLRPWKVNAPRSIFICKKERSVSFSTMTV